MVSNTDDDFVWPVKVGSLHASGLYVEDEERIVRLLDWPRCLGYAKFGLWLYRSVIDRWRTSRNRNGHWDGQCYWYSERKGSRI